jgi:uncharacterized protein (TIGR03083 family)
MRSSSSGWTEQTSPAHGSVLTLDKAEIVAASSAQRTRTMELLRSIPEPEWETIVVPRWRLREVAAHLVTTDEGAITGRSFLQGFTRNATDAIAKIEVWNDKQVGRWADRPIPEILAGLEKWSRRFERLVRMVPAAVARPALITPFGKVSLMWLFGLRVYDEWIHGEDIRRAYNLPSDDPQASIRPVARQLIAGLPMQSCSRVREDARGRVAVAFGDVDYPPLGFDLGARRFGYGVDGADAIVTGPTAVIAMVSARRDPWRDVEASGGLKVEGDRAPAEALLDALQLV